jgi:hypothetical protein
MRRFLDNLVIDLIAGGLMIGMIATGYVLRCPLPPGSNKSLTLWNLTRHQWGDIHFWISLGLLAVILLHVCLHWQWITLSVRRRLSRAKGAPGSGLFSGLIALLVLAAILLLFGWATHSGVDRITEPREGVCPPTAPEGGDHEGGADGTTPNISGQGGQPEVAFRTAVYPALERSCLPCHGPKQQRGGFRVDRKEDYFGKGGKPGLIVPGKCAESPLVAIVSGQRKDIPRPDVHRLSVEQVNLLRAWIDAGAPWPAEGGAPR